MMWALSTLLPAAPPPRRWLAAMLRHALGSDGAGGMGPREAAMLLTALARWSRAVGRRDNR
jgi:hypothetical protein